MLLGVTSRGLETSNLPQLWDQDRAGTKRCFSIFVLDRFSFCFVFGGPGGGFGGPGGGFLLNSLSSGFAITFTTT